MSSLHHSELSLDIIPSYYNLSHHIISSIDSSRHLPELSLFMYKLHLLFSSTQTLVLLWEVFDLVHSNVWTAPCISRGNHKYYITFIDEKIKYTWITLISSKDLVLEAFKNFQIYVTTQVMPSRPSSSTWDITSNELPLYSWTKWCGWEKEYI